ncbi:probable acyl-CoA dehydrogenase 6 [Salvelinus sp. IW2-2015]|uniref:probable acyl-CoA dehydrogenase 6 n=1 Tax=Salvelinus sp. IW2-2015 TaxID=2691554 RepID=UPI0038D3E192
MGEKWDTNQAPEDWNCPGLTEGVCVYVCCAEYGGLGLDFSYSIAVSDKLCNIRCGGIPMAIGVQTDMATPALAGFGSEELKKEFLLPSIMGDKVACLGVKWEPVPMLLGFTSPARSTRWGCLPTQPRSSSMTCTCPARTSLVRRGWASPIRCCSSKRDFGRWANLSLPTLGVVTMRDNIIQDTIQYTRQRKICKMSVLYHQSVHFRLAELETEIELLHSLLHRSTALYIKGNDVTKLASMAKLKAGHLSR